MARPTPSQNVETHRVGIIPFDTREGAVALLFVTSQTRGRWILPKGWLMEGLSAAAPSRRRWQTRPRSSSPARGLSA